MKRFVSSCLLAVAAVGFMMGGCAQDKSKLADKTLAKGVEGVQEQLPHKLKDGTTLVAVDYNHKVLTYRIETSKDTLDAIKLDTLRNKTLERLNSLLNRKMVNNIVDAQATVKYVLMSGTDSVVYIFNPKDF